MEKEKYKLRKVGRPLKFKRASDLEEAIEKYFDTTPKDEWTITGLALALGTTRRILIQYGQRDLYRPIVEKAKLKVENSYELDLKKKGQTRSIFALKAMGWSDKQEIDVTSKGEALGNTIILKSMGKDEANS